MKFVNKLLFTTLLAICWLSTTAFAGDWQQDQTGWYWAEADGTYPTASWQWIDSNQDGVAECYYFNEQGYLLTNTTTPSGDQVDASGRWIVNDQVQEQRPSAAGSADAKAIYQQAQIKQSSSDGLNIHCDVKTTVSGTGFQASSSSVLDFKMKGATKEDLQVLIAKESTVLDNTSIFSMFYKDGYLYLNVDGNKLKGAFSKQDVLASTDYSAVASKQVSDLTDLQMTTDATGNHHLTFNYAPEYINSFTDLLTPFTENLDVSNIQITSCTGTATINPDGFFNSITTTMTVQVQIEGQTVTAQAQNTMTYVNPGQPVDFALPSTDGYEEISL